MRVGFLGNYSKEWMGGVNYLKNLLFAIQSTPTSLSPIVFVGADTDPSIRESFASHAPVIEVSILTRKSLSWFIWRATKKIFQSDLFLEIYLSKYKIDIFSHSDVYPMLTKAVNWIPDFQHIHLPHMFSDEEVGFRNRSFHRAVKCANRVIVSSRDALRDLHQFDEGYASKGRVLNFVAQPKRELMLDRPELEAEILKKHSLHEPFFYLPNQFWKHKNHRVVFEALAILKAKGKPVSLVCSGKMSDYRDDSYFPELKKFVDEKALEVQFLGLIDYDDVMVLMKRSVAVINPSLFEGWSSTVEECKVIGKNLILSNIPVHLEQNPSQGLYFDPKNADELARILGSVWDLPMLPVPEKMDLEAKTHEFAQTFEKILNECF